MPNDDSNNDLTITNNAYYACKDSNRPVCRQFINQGKCHYHNKCKFYHPEVISPIIKRKATRKLGYCFCGSSQRCVINNRHYRAGENDNIVFFVVCSQTGRSMRYCM